MEAKEQIVRRFLDFVRQYVSLSQARMATLGGMGVEAKAWIEAGIPPSNGSLIEIESDLARKLIRKYDFRTHDRLDAFHTVLANYGEKVDGFHLDLCGTMNVEVTGDFAPTLPFILQSQGRCLAVTVADARQNTILTNWSDYRTKGKKFFGRKMRTVFTELNAQQRKIPVKANPKLPKFFKRGFNPHKATQREFGFMLDMAELLQVHKCSIKSMERFVYVSRYNNRPFRMRTYFFHFGLGIPADQSGALAKVWTESPLVFIDQDVIEVIATDNTVAQQKEKLSMSSKLAHLVAAAGNDELQREFDELLENARIGAAIKATLNGSAESLLSGHKSQNGSAQAKPKKKWDDLTVVEQYEFRLKVNNARHEHMKTGTTATWAKECLPELIREQFGHMPKHYPKSIGAYVARMNGSYRSSFIDQVKEALPAEIAADYLKRLEAIPK